MTERTPPKLATALLNALGPRDGAVSGDLREVYADGRSRGWYWRQVVTVILVTNYPIVIARGVATGWLTLWAFRFVTADFNRQFSNWSLDWLIINLGSHPFVMLWAVVLSGRPFQLAAYLLSGWTVARFHRRYSTMAVFWFMVTVLVRSAWQAANWFKLQARVYNEIAFPIWMAAFAALPLIILLGGWLANAPPKLRRLA